MGSEGYKPEGPENFKMPEGAESEEESLEKADFAFEVDYEFLQEGLTEEIEKARNKEAEGKEEHYGRSAFVAARSHEIGVPVEVNDQLWSDIKQKGLDFKIQKQDAWGTAFTASYMKDIDPARYEELRVSVEELKEIFKAELDLRIEAARGDVNKWKDVFAFTEHLEKLDLSPLEMNDFVIDDVLAEKIMESLSNTEDPIAYLETVNAIEATIPGTLHRFMPDRSGLQEALEEAESKAQEAREQKDAWLYAKIARNIKKAEQLI